MDWDAFLAREEEEAAHHDWIRETYGRPEDHVFLDELYEEPEEFHGPIQLFDWVGWMNFIDNWKALASHLDPLPF